MGKFELVASAGRAGKQLQQVVTQYLPISGNCPAHYFPMSLIGDMFASDTNISVDVMLPTASAAAFVAARTREWHSANADGAFRTRVPGVFVWLGPSAGEGKAKFRACSDNNCTVVLASGVTAASLKTWYRLSLLVNGSKASGALGGAPLFSDVKLPPSAPSAQAALSQLNSTQALAFPTGHITGSGWSAIGSTFEAVAFDNFRLVGAHSDGAHAVRPCAGEGVTGKAVQSYPCDHPGASTRWVIGQDGHVKHGSQHLCMLAQGGRAVVGVCAGEPDDLMYDNSTGRIMAGGKCLTVRPSVGSYPGADAVPAQAVVSPCDTLPANRQQFQFSHGRGILRPKTGGCVERGYSFGPNDPWDNYRDCCLALC